MLDGASQLGRLRFSIGLPLGWITLPTDVGHIGTALAAFDAGVAVEAELTRAIAAAAAQGKPARQRYVYLGVATPAHVRAWASLDLLPTGGVGAAGFAATLETSLLEPSVHGDSGVRGGAGVGGGAEVRSREVHSTELAGLPAVVLYELLESSVPSDRSRLYQRFVATLFVPDQSVAVQFQLSTDDFAAFGDFLAVGLAMAGSLTLHETALE